MMSLINPVLLYGLALTVIPVLLHFLLKSKPKKMIFPALRLLLDRQRQTTRRLRLRHFWLLLLRILVIGLFVIALSRPSLPAINYTPTLLESTAFVLIIAGMFLVYRWFSKMWDNQNLAEQAISRKKNRLQASVVITGLLLLALLVGWPYQKRIRAELSKPHPEMLLNVPVAAVFLIDNSLSMDYRLQNQTRLDQGKSIALKQIEKLPSGSKLAVADLSATESILFQGDLNSAKSRIEKTEISSFTVPINTRLQSALKLQEEDIRRISSVREKKTDEKKETSNDKFSREIYLFTDLAKSAWNDKTVETLKKELERQNQIQLYIIDVGVEETGDYSVRNIQLSSNSVSPEGHLSVYSEISTSGNLNGPVQVELYLTDRDNQSIKRGEKSVNFDEGQSVEVQFQLKGIDPPFSQGEIKILAGDPYSHDDIRYFTVAVKDLPKVLVVADSISNTVYWKNALAPKELIDSGKVKYQVETMTTSELDSADLNSYKAIYLVKSAAPSNEGWRNLEDYVYKGGGLGIFLSNRNGDDAKTALSYNSETAQELVPGKLLADLNFDPAMFLDFSTTQHPAIRFFQLYTAGELTTSPVWHYWRVEPDENAEILIRYTDERSSPYLISRQHENGRVLLMTSSADLEDEWNNLPRTSWFLVLADQLTRYLCALENQRYNYLPGEPVSIQLGENSESNHFLLRTPELQQLPLERKENDAYLILENLSEAGQYSLYHTENSQNAVYGFSINNRIEESNFQRLDPSELDQYLGKDRYRIAREDADLERAVSDLRMGKEMYSVVLMIMILIFCGEHFFANWFYADQTKEPEVAAS